MIHKSLYLTDFRRYLFDEWLTVWKSQRSLRCPKDISTADSLNTYIGLKEFNVVRTDLIPVHTPPRFLPPLWSLLVVISWLFFPVLFNRIKLHRRIHPCQPSPSPLPRGMVRLAWLGGSFFSVVILAVSVLPHPYLENYCLDQLHTNYIILPFPYLPFQDNILLSSTI